jgi:hypothetical protein
MQIACGARLPETELHGFGLVFRGFHRHELPGRSNTPQRLAAVRIRLVSVASPDHDFLFHGEVFEG